MSKLGDGLGEADKDGQRQEKQQVKNINKTDFEKAKQALMEAEQRRLREVEEELGNGLIQLREKIHKQEVKKQLRENFTKTHISRCLQWRKKFSKQRKSWR